MVTQKRQYPVCEGERRYRGSAHTGASLVSALCAALLSALIFSPSLCSTRSLAYAQPQAQTTPQDTLSYQNPALNYSFSLPPGWERIPDSALQKMAAAAAEGLEVPQQDFAAAFQKSAEHDFTYPYLVVQHHAGASSLEEIMNSFDDPQVATVTRKLELSDLLNELSLDRPTIDSARNAVMNRVHMDVPGAGAVDGLVALFPGALGTVQLNFYAAGADFAKDLPAFEQVLDSFSFREGFESPTSLAPEEGAARRTILLSVLLVAAAALLGAAFFGKRARRA